MTHFDAGDPRATDPIDRQSSRPNLGVLCYPVITLGKFTHQGSKNHLLGANPPLDLVEDLSNEKQVKKDGPPVFLWHTQEDKAVPVENSLMFAAALRKACGALSHPSLKRLKNQTAVFIDMFKQLDEQREVGTKAAWFETLDRLEDLARRVPRVGEALMRAELEHTAKYACFAAGRGAFRRDDAGGETIAKLRDALRGIDAEHARLWRLRCREGGLAHSRSFFAQIDGMFAERGSGVTMFE